MQHPKCIPTDLIPSVVELQASPLSLCYSIHFAGIVQAITNSRHHLPKKDQVQLLPVEISALQSHTFTVLFCEQCGAWLLMVIPTAAASIIEKLLQLVIGDLFLSTCSYLTMKQNGSYSKTKN